MTVYVIFNHSDEMMEICKDAPTALAWLNGFVEESYHVSRDAYNIYVHTDKGTYTIVPWHVQE